MFYITTPFRDINLILSDSLITLVETDVNHFLKQSLELVTIKNIQTECTQIFTTRGCGGVIAVN